MCRQLICKRNSLGSHFQFNNDDDGIVCGGLGDADAVALLSIHESKHACARPPRSFIVFRFYLYYISTKTQTKTIECYFNSISLYRYFYLFASRFVYNHRHTQTHRDNSEFRRGNVDVRASNSCIKINRWQCSTILCREKVNINKASFTLDCLFCANKFYSDIRTVAKLNDEELTTTTAA